MYPFVALLGILVACPAEQLGVELPKGGSQALSQEDLQRDVYMLAALGERRPGSAGYAEGTKRVAQRLDQMKTLPASGAGGNLCTQRDGSGGRALVLAALDEDDGADRSASAVAGLISLAKTFDVPTPPRHTVLFCVFPEPGGLDAYLRSPAFPLEKTVAILALGPLGGAQLRSEERVLAGGVRMIALSTGADAVHGTPEDRMERLDFRVLQRNVERVLEAVDSLMAI